MKSYQWIYDHVMERVEKDKVLARFDQVRSVDEITQLDDSYLLSNMSRRVFRAGIKHSVVDAKWPEFEKAFFGFMPQKVALMSDDQLEKLMQNDKIIRHWGKIKSTRLNAFMVTEYIEKYGSFASFIAQWPVDDIVGLWIELKKQGSHLGGNSAAYFLRLIAKDTFVLTDDVVAALIAQGIVDRRPTSQRDLRLVQQTFNQWHEQSGEPLSHISRLLAHTIGWEADIYK
ncbi:DNA-3-methyladenine glycosylase I [Gammaproteobacteria bacterium AS21]